MANTLNQLKDKISNIFTHLNRLDNEQLWHAYRSIIKSDLLCYNYQIPLNDIIGNTPCDHLSPRQKKFMMKKFGGNEHEIKQMMNNCHNYPHLILDRCQNNQTFHKLVMNVCKYMYFGHPKYQDFINRLQTTIEKLHNDHIFKSFQLSW